MPCADAVEPARRRRARCDRARSPARRSSRSTASTLPTRSTTAIVARAFRAPAPRPRPARSTRCTSASVRKFCGAAQSPVQPPVPALPDDPEHPASSRPASDERGRAVTILAATGRPSATRVVPRGLNAGSHGCFASWKPWHRRQLEVTLLLDRARCRRGTRGTPRCVGIATSADALRVRHVVAIGALRLRVATCGRSAPCGIQTVVGAHRRHVPVHRAVPRVTSWQVLHTRTSKSSVATLLGLALREAQRDLALGLRGLAHAAQQPFARNAEGLLEAVAHAVQREVRVELLDHDLRVGGLAVRHLARGHRGLELRAGGTPGSASPSRSARTCASRRPARGSSRIRASRGPGRATCTPFGSRCDACGNIEVRFLRDRRLRPGARASRPLRREATAGTADGRVAKSVTFCAMAPHALPRMSRWQSTQKRSSSRCVRLDALVVAVARGAARALEEPSPGLRDLRAPHVMADVAVALEARAVLHVLEGDLVARGALRLDRLVREDHRPRVPEPVADDRAFCAAWCHGRSSTRPGGDRRRRPRPR